MKKNALNLIGIAILFCFSYTISAQTAGTLSFVFTPVSPGTGWYNGQTNKHVLAVWIESCAVCGSGTTAGTSTFVRTKIRNWGGSTNDHLPTWASKSGSSTTNATTGSTLSTWTATTVTWDGKNAAQTALLTDGNYRMCIQETWGHGTSTVTRYFPFVKGSAIDNQTPTADTHFSNISLVWTPTLATENFSVNPEAVVYPNPTKGIVTIDFKSDVKNIKVVDLLGKEVYNEEIKEATSSTSKRIDLSGFNDGIYFINISNENGKSTYKVLLEK